MSTATPSHSFVRYQLPAIVWAVMIFISSSIPAERLPDVALFRFDKGIHFGIYFVLALLTFRAIRHQHHFPFVARHAFLGTVLAIVGYGALDEIHQYFVPGRDANLLDLAADATGAVVLVAALWWYQRSRPAAKTE